MQQIITTSIDQEIMNFVRHSSKKSNVPQNSIIEKALRMYKEYEERKALKETFIRASKDPEMLAMAEEEMDDYFDQIKNL